MVNKKEEKKCGMVSIVGRPNVGKSTLLNQIVGEKVSIVSKVPQTTRNKIRGIFNDERGQIIFIDTPGLVLGKDKLDLYLKKSSFTAMADADCIIYLVDTNRFIGLEEREIASRLNDLKCPIILGLNKVDLGGKNIPEYISLWESLKGKKITELKDFAMLAVSGEKGTHVTKLVDAVFDFLPTGPLLYDVNTVCDVPQNIVMADIIREKLINLLRDEIPHAVAVVIESIEQRRRKVLYVVAQILVERESQKMIVIGEGGQLIKKVGIQARKELEQIFERKVYLETRVKAKKDWRENEGLLKEMGYSD